MADHPLIVELCNQGGQGGWTYSLQTEFAFAELKSILDLTDIEGDFLTKGLFNLAKGTDFSKENLLSEIRKEVKNRNTQSPFKKFIFLLPVLLNFNLKTNSLPAFIFLSHRFRFLSLASARKRYRVSPLLDLNKLRQRVHHEIKDHPKHFLEFACSHRTPGEAYEMMSPILTAFRGVIEISMNYMNTVLGAERGPRCSMPHPEWALVLTENEKDFQVEGLTFLVDPYKPPNQKFDVMNLQNARKIIRFFRTPPKGHSIFDLLLNVLRLYAIAMDQRFPSSAFVGFWQAAEALTFSQEFGGKTEVVSKRLGAYSDFVNLNTFKWTNLVERFAKKRNDIVHNGKEAADQEDVNLFKVLIEMVFMILIRLRKVFSHEEDLKNWFLLRNKKKEDLGSISRMLKFIKTRKESTA